MGLGSHIPRFDLHPQHICFSEFATRKKTWIKKSRGSLTLEKMSRINKLSILGVRSFDNTRAEAIQFHTPLTLIVGYNGSGKTTIIECLKYSTTGELPPNSKGGAFIHDPSLCGEKEVLAQVKLSFQNTSGEQMVITRNLQLTVKKNTRQQKTLEGSLLTKTRNGERTSISSRVAELDLVMPHHLGVSKAVLDFVIFCHQDESLWPMSEPAPLKKKFDEIFEALKYTKAIDNIKLLRKTKAEELKRLKDNEIHSKEIKNKGDKAEKHSRVLHAAICEIRDEIEDHEIKAKEADRKYQDASDRAAQYTTIIGQLDNHQAKKTWLQDSLDRLGKNLKKRDESDEWLQSEFNQYEERVDGYRTLEERQMQQYQGLERCSKSAEAKLSGKHVEAGKYEEQKANHEQQIEKRKVLVKETSRQHNIRGYDTELDDVQINEYMDKICRLSKDQNAAVEKARRETEREMGKIQNALNKLGERRSVLEENKNAAKEQLSANSGLLRTRQVELNNIETDEGSRAILEADTGDIEVRLKRAREDSDRASWDSKTKENEIQLRMLNDESGQLNEDYHQRTKQAGELAKLDQLKRDAADCQRNLDKMEAVHSDRLKIVVGHNWKPSDLERHFDRAMDQKGRHVKEAERERGVVSRGLEQVDYKLTNVKTDLRKAEKELATCIKHLNNNVDGDPEDYTETLSNIQDARDLFKADFDNFENTRQYFAKGITVAQGKHQCNLCQRAFHGKEMTDFVKKMEEKLAKLTAEKVAKDLEEAEEDLRKAKAAGPSHDTWLRLSKTELPRLHEEAKKLTAEKEKMLREVENHDKIVKDKEEAKMDAESLAKPVANIVKYQNDLTRFSGQMNESVASNQDSDMHRTLDDIRDQLHTLQSKVQDKRNEIDRLKTDKERARSLISTLELDLSKANNKLSTATHELEKKQTISRQIGELRIAKQGRQNTIREIEVKLQDLAPQCAEEETKMQDIRRRGLDKENDLHQESVRLLDSVQQLKLAAKNIALYVDDGGSAKLDKCGREIKGIEQEISGIKDEQRQVTISINKIKKELNDQDTTKDTILKNIEYRRSLKDLERVKTEIAELSAQNDEVDREHWLKQRAYWERSLNEHTTQRTSKLGTARAKDDELVRLLEDWKTEYKDAARNFKKAHIEVETTKAAIDDLGRYASALDKAIMKYHGIKMEEINRIIEELWKKTYQGTDVDTILIRSDNEGARQNRSYNYRVCMVKQDAEMDMRGRCSAGQKVLASIIIRLALAECFGVNCGLIALDEPTTNLDRDNIRSLATSLHDIIEARRHQSNFQLIVITHDEEFLKEMKCPDFCDHYYRVSRSERQKSTIEKQSIADVM